MLKRLLVVAAFAAILVPSTSHAVDHAGNFALGYFFDDAPIGFRYMLNQKIGLDAGIGFSSSEGPDFTDPGETSSNSQFTFELGAQFNVVQTDRADFFVRPSFSLTSIPYFSDDTTNPITSENVTDTRFGAMLGAEWHATDNLSLSFGHGIGITSSHGIDAGDLFVSPTEPESSSSINTIGLTTGFSSIGFRWYFN